MLGTPTISVDMDVLVLESLQYGPKKPDEAVVSCTMLSTVLLYLITPQSRSIRTPSLAAYHQIPPPKLNAVCGHGLGRS